MLEYPISNMFDTDKWKEIFQTIQKNKLRTFLSGFTVSLGIFIFVLLFGLGNGLKNSFLSFFQDDATNVFYIIPSKTSLPYKGYKSDRLIEFDNNDLDEINVLFSPFIESSTPRISRQKIIKFKNNFNNYTVRGVSPDHQITEKTILMKGRYINLNDIKQKTKNIVIGRLVAKDLFLKESPIGNYLDVGGIAFKIVGVFQDEGGDNEERIVYIPYSTLQLTEKNNDKLDMILLGFNKSLGHVGSLTFEKKLYTYLKEKKNISPRDTQGIYIRNTTDQIKRNEQFAGVLQLIVTFVGLGTLISGIIGISNIMVFVVKERTKEIGIRKTFGATPLSIIQMILYESIFITTFSGYVGLFSGVFVLNSIGLSLENYLITNPYININTGIFATIILIVFGAIAGYIPARRSARIKPIEAIRDF